MKKIGEVCFIATLLAGQCLAQTGHQASNKQYVLENSLSLDIPHSLAMLINKVSHCKVVVDANAEKRQYKEVFKQAAVIDSIGNQPVDVFVLRASKEICEDGKQRPVKGTVIVPVSSSGAVSNGTNLVVEIDR